MRSSHNAPWCVACAQGRVKGPKVREGEIDQQWIIADDTFHTLSELLESSDLCVVNICSQCNILPQLCSCGRNVPLSTWKLNFKLKLECCCQVSYHRIGSYAWCIIYLYHGNYHGKGGHDPILLFCKSSQVLWLSLSSSYIVLKWLEKYHANPLELDQASDSKTHWPWCFLPGLKLKRLLRRGDLSKWSSLQDHDTLPFLLWPCDLPYPLALPPLTVLCPESSLPLHQVSRRIRNVTHIYL